MRQPRIEQQPSEEAAFIRALALQLPPEPTTIEAYTEVQKSQVDVRFADKPIRLYQEVRYVVVEDKEGRSGVGEKVIEYRCIVKESPTVVDYQVQLFAPSDGVTMPVVITEFTHHGGEDIVLQQRLQAVLREAITQHVTERYRCTPAITVASQETKPVVDSTELEMETENS